MLFQCIEDTWSVSVFVSGIKSEVDFFFIGIFSIVGMILAKIVDRGIPDRAFSLLSKTSRAHSSWCHCPSAQYFLYKWPDPG